MTDSTLCRCDDCGEMGRVFVEHEAVIRKKKITWKQCPRCFAVSEGRMVAAVDRAEKAGVS